MLVVMSYTLSKLELRKVAFFMVGDNKQSDLLLSVCQFINSVLYIIFIIFSIISACYMIFDHRFYPKRPLASQNYTNNNIISRFILTADSKYWVLIIKWQQYPHHREWLIAEALVDKSVTLGILEWFVKELDVMVACYGLKPYC